MDKETDLLSRLATNHLHLAQFEPLRATLLSLRAKNPDLALTILQTIIAHSGRFKNILWSPSCPSPSLLTFLSTLELLQFKNPTSSTWTFDPDSLRLRVEFLLLIQMLNDGVSHSLRSNVDLDSIEKEKEKDNEESSGFGEKFELLNESEGLRGGDGDVDGDEELSDCVRVLDRVLEFGVKRLKPDLIVDRSERKVDLIEEKELECLKRVVLDYADVFGALCWNIQRQVKGWEGFDSGSAITVRREEEKAEAEVELLEEEEEEEDCKVLGLIQRSVQLAHLDAMNKCVEEDDVEGAVSRIRFLHLDYGVEEGEYRYMFCFFVF